MSADLCVLKEPIRPWWSGQMIAALRKHAGTGAAETGESDAQERINRREG